MGAMVHILLIGLILGIPSVVIGACELARKREDDRARDRKE